MAILIRISLLIWTASILFACEKQNTTQTDPKLVGKWTDKNVRYYFYPTRAYGLKYLRKGFGLDTVTTDSSYGSYTLDVSNNTVSFLLTGIKLKSGTFVGVNINGGVWNYAIKDTVLTYTSLTSNGRLVRF